MAQEWPADGAGRGLSEKCRLTALTNFRMMANVVWSTEEVLAKLNNEVGRGIDRRDPPSQ